ncbi:MAG: hypothetical protein ACJAVK_002269 [Akkermansiaceae bacterium]|jgi:hypothetical protein
MAVEEAQPRHLRFIPFFDLPVWRCVGVAVWRCGGVAVWRETGLPSDGPKVELPPSPVAIVSGDSAVPFQLAARSFSELVTIKAGADSFPVGRIRWVNVSNKVLMVQWGGAKARPFKIASGKSVMKPIVVGETFLRVGYLDGNGRVKEIWCNKVTVRGNQRVQCFFYKADPENGKKAVKLYFIPEAIPKLPDQVRKMEAGE